MSPVYCCPSTTCHQIYQTHPISTELNKIALADKWIFRLKKSEQICYACYRGLHGPTGGLMQWPDGYWMREFGRAGLYFS